MPKKAAEHSTTSTSISIIGPGRLGQALAIALDHAGYKIKALVSRGAAKASKVATSLPFGRESVQALGINQLAKLELTDVILVTTPDDAIEGVAQKLARLQPRSAKPIVLHTSGALSSEILSQLAHVGFHTGSLHPLVSVSDSVSGAAAFRGAFFCVEGDRDAKRTARRIVSDLGGKSFEVAAKSKPLYHAAALMSAGHMTALVDLAAELLVSCGLKPSDARKVLMPLVESAVKNLKVSSPEKALTGTFARGDVATVKRHLSALADNSDADAVMIYKLLGMRSLELANKKGIDKKVLIEIRRMLSS